MFGKLLAVKPLLWAVGLLLALNLAQWGMHTVEVAGLEKHLAEVTGQRNNAQTQLSATERARNTAVATNEGQRKVIEDLAARLDMAITENENIDRLLTDANNTLRLVQRQRADALAQLEAERENDYATDPNCSSWGAAPVCGRITGGLLDQWRGAQAAGRGGAESGGGGSAPTAGAGVGGNDGGAAPEVGPTPRDPGQ
ncbi:MAG TPA: hypothetical protein PK861_01460 [Thermomonas sp.]|nr:hypothetical protein [Thermomonas sp.]